jgi:hypothetical protein
VRHLRTSRRGARHAAALAVATALLLACAWLCSLLPPSLAFDETFTTPQYDAQLHSLLAGKWNLPRKQTDREGFVVNGRYYIYFGPTPVLLRLPFAAAVERFPQKAGFVSVFLAAALGLWAGLRVAREVSGKPTGPFEVLAVSGLVLAIASRSAVYHEAIAWGGTFALLSGLHALRYLRTPTLPRLGAIAAFGALAVFSREIWLIGVGALLGLLAVSALVPRAVAASRGPLGHGLAAAKCWIGLPDVARAGAHVALAGVTLATVLAVQASIHHAKFGGWGLSPPIEAHMSFQDPARLARIGGRMFHLGNLPTGVYNYFSPTSALFSSRFPWIGPSPRVRVLPGAYVDGAEHFFGLPHIAGALVLLTAIGVWGVRAHPRIRPGLAVAAALGLGSATVFCFAGLCGRYLYDFYPPLALAGGAGVAVLRETGRSGLRAAVRVVAVCNLVAGLSMAFVVQRSYGDAPRRSALRALGARIDAIVLR